MADADQRCGFDPPRALQVGVYRADMVPMKRECSEGRNAPRFNQQTFEMNYGNGKSGG